MYPNAMFFFLIIVNIYLQRTAEHFSLRPVCCSSLLNTKLAKSEKLKERKNWCKQYTHTNHRIFMNVCRQRFSTINIFHIPLLHQLVVTNLAEQFKMRNDNQANIYERTLCNVRQTDYTIVALSQLKTRYYCISLCNISGVP